MTILFVPVTKAGSSVTVDTDKIHDTMYAEALAQGLKVMVNGGMTKLTKENIPDETARKAEALKIAEDRVNLMIEGKLKLGRQAAASKGPSGAVMTEARRLARIAVKEMLKSKGLKVSTYDASEITKAANEIIAADPSYVTTAESNLATRGKGPVPTNIDITAMIQPDPKKVAELEAKKVEKAGVLSKTQAGKVAPRAVPAH